jgi:hypothetical protein
MDRSLKAVLAFTFVYGVFATALLAAQPLISRVHSVAAGGNVEQETNDTYYLPDSADYVLLASAE